MYIYIFFKCFHFRLWFSITSKTTATKSIESLHEQRALKTFNVSLFFYLVIITFVVVCFSTLSFSLIFTFYQYYYYYYCIEPSNSIVFFLLHSHTHNININIFTCFFSRWNLKWNTIEIYPLQTKINILSLYSTYTHTHIFIQMDENTVFTVSIIIVIISLIGFLITVNLLVYYCCVE